MAVIKNIVIAVSAATVIAACASRWDVQGVRELPVNGSLFDKAIKQEFVDFAELESKRGDWDETRVFLSKARLSTIGMSPNPDKPETRKIPQQYANEVQMSYARLLRALESNARTNMPEEAAWAQVGYECWIESLEENLFPYRIEACKKKFENAMELIERDPKSPYRITASSKDVPTHAYVDGKYVVYFAFNSTAVDRDALSILREAAKSYHENNPNEVTVSGHADTVGSDKVNLIVSRRRAESVSVVLNKAGVPRDKINVRAYGKRNLAVQTPDNVREPRNRRVEVNLIKMDKTALSSPIGEVTVSDM